MAGVHRLEHVERLGSADLADDDAVGPHAQRVAHEVADRDLAVAFGVLDARLQPQHVLLVELELGRLLDRDEPIVLRDGADMMLRSVVLPVPVPPEISTLRRAFTQRSRKSTLSSVTVPEADEVGASSRRLGNFRIVRGGPLSDSGGSTAFRRLPSGRRASTIGCDSSIRRPAWVTILTMIRRRWESSMKRIASLGDASLALDPDVARAVGHDLRDRLVGKQPLDRAVAEDVIGHLSGDPLPVGPGDPGLPVELRGDVGLHS